MPRKDGITVRGFVTVNVCRICGGPLKEGQCTILEEAYDDALLEPTRPEYQALAENARLLIEQHTEE